jgi:hypothetical protein
VTPAARTFIIVLTAGASLGLGVFGVRLRKDRDVGRDRAAVLQARLTALDKRYRSLQEECLRLQEQAAAQSNALVKAEARYRQERQTLQPLRRQIEKMEAKAIADADLLRLKTEEIKRLQTGGQ